MMNNTVHKAIRGTWVLTIASLFSELLSAVYRIPLQNIVGDRGYFIYQQVYPIYGIFSVLALTGLPVVLSKTFAQQADPESKKKLLKWVFLILLGLAIIATAVIWMLSKSMARFMGDINLYPEIRTVSLAFLLIPFEVSLRGLFQSDLVMEPSAISQVIEQLVRIVLIIAAALMFSRQSIDLYQMGALANSGAFVGGLFAVVILFFTYLLRQAPITKKQSQPVIKLETGLGLEIVLIIFFTGITIFYQFIDSFSMIRLLMSDGMALGPAEVAKGVFDRAQPLIQLGIVISLSFISTIMPQLKKGDDSQTRKNLIERLVRVCTVIAVAETAGLVALMPDINTMLFTNTNGSVALAIYMCSIFFVSVINLLVAVTSSDSRQNLAKLVLFIISLIVKIGLNIVLVPAFHIAGAALATVMSELVILLGMLFIYRNQLGFLVLKWTFLGKAIWAGLLMSLSVRAIEQLIVYYIPLNRLSSIFVNVVLIPIGIIIFVVLAVLLKLLKKQEWEILPLGKWLTKIIKIEE